jgi:hypothetical protein
MSRKFAVLPVLAAVLLAASPAWAMSTDKVPSLTLKDGTLRYNDPNGSLLNNFSLSFGATSGSYGYGSSYGTGAYGNSYGSTFGSSNQPNGSSSNNPFTSSYLPSTNPGLSPTVPSGARLTDPTFGPNGRYSQGLRGANP